MATDRILYLALSPQQVVVAVGKAIQTAGLAIMAALAVAAALAVVLLPAAPETRLQSIRRKVQMAEILPRMAVAAVAVRLR